MVNRKTRNYPFCDFAHRVAGQRLFPRYSECGSSGSMFPSRTAKGLLAVLIGALSFGGRASAQSFLTNGLVAYYPFSGNANDESGYGNNLTNYGATLCADRFGNPNRAYSFNGTNFLGSSVPPPLTQFSNWTVTAWIDPTVLPQNTAYAVCVGYDNLYSGDGFAMGVSGSELWAFFPGVGFAPGGADFVSTNEWYQIVMTSEADTIVMYLNGAPGTNSSPISGSSDPPTSLEIGSGGNAYPSGTARSFIGAIDDVRVYNRVLSSFEIQELNQLELGDTLPLILSQPTNQITVAGGDAMFGVLAFEQTNSPPLTYLWVLDGTNIAGATSSELILTNVQPAQAGAYSVVVSNAFGAVTSSSAMLTVVASPLILDQPTNLVLSVGDSAALSVAVFGALPLTYQWTMNGNNLSQATNSSLLLENVQTNLTGTYSVIVKNEYGAITSSNALLEVEIPPTIDIPPQGEAILVPGSNVTLSVTAFGLPLSYQWVLDGLPLVGQTVSSLVLTNFSALNSGQYAVIVSNAVGVVTSTPALLSFQSGSAFLDPRAFLSLGLFNPAGNVVIDASTGQMSGGASFAGVPVTNAGFVSFVFAFSSFTLESGLQITVTNCGSGTPGISLLSQNDMIINGTIDASASSASATNCGPGLGGTGGSGNNASHLYGSGGGGGGFGGNGGEGSQFFYAAPGAGGGTYNPDLTAQLADGSCGGPGGGGDGEGAGGNGGAAIQLAAVDTLTLSGTVLANGATGNEASPGSYRDNSQGSGGGGSGGALLIRANNVTINSGATLSANGGGGGPGGSIQGDGQAPVSIVPGGGGGGGRIVVDYVSAGINDGLITASGGSGGGAEGTLFFGQNPMILPFPIVAISHTAPETVALSWPATATNYTLQIRPALGPASAWTNAPGGIEIGENIVQIYPASGAGAFFRLKHN